MTDTKLMRPMSALKREVERLFEDLVPSFLQEPLVEGVWTPRLDLSETQEAYVAKLDLPGVQREEIKVSYEDKQLRITGERKVEKTEAGEDFHRVERMRGSFYRALLLPEPVREDGIEAQFKDGVLVIRLPKREVRTPREIPVNG